MTMNKMIFNSSLYRADNILYTGEEMRRYYENNGIAAKGRINHAYHLHASAQIS